jgi:hypothetical protein
MASKRESGDEKRHNWQLLGGISAGDFYRLWMRFGDRLTTQPMDAEVRTAVTARLKTPDTQAIN